MLLLHLSDVDEASWAEKLKAALARIVNMPVSLKINSQLSSFYVSQISTGSGE